MLPPSLVTYSRSPVDLRSVVKDAVSVADEDSDAGFLEDANVVVVCVSHCPTGRVLLGFLVISFVDIFAMTFWPLLPGFLVPQLKIEKGMSHMTSRLL